MKNFSFHNPTQILFGEGQIAKIAKLIPANARILLAYGGGSIKKNGVYEQVIAALAGMTIIEFSGIEPNPQYETLMRAVSLARREKIDFILAVGGGSVIDGSKFIAAAIPFNGEPWDLLTQPIKVTEALALGCILTLPATGTESNGNAVITRSATQDKLPFESPLLYPRFAVLDPSVTFSLPARQLSNGVIDAFVHTMEQYLTYPVDAKVQDRFAEGLLLTLIEEGPRALAEPNNYALRANIMWAATMALNGLIGVGVPQDWSSHALGHQLTALKGLDHAQTLAIMLPAVMQHQRRAKRAKLIQYGRRVWGLEETDEEALIDATIATTRAFFEAMGTATRLSDYGLGRDVIPQLVQMLIKHKLVALGEQGKITPVQAHEIFELAL
jgi:NADP-dependent alcohol dehydrogenase